MPVLVQQLTLQHQLSSLVFGEKVYVEKYSEQKINGSYTKCGFSVIPDH